MRTELVLIAVEIGQTRRRIARSRASIADGARLCAAGTARLAESQALIRRL